MSEILRLDPLPVPPDLPGTVVVRPDVEDLTESIAAELLIHAHNCVRTFGDFHLALSGGRTPEPLYRRLMIDPKFRDLPWRKTHLWFVGEWRVPFDDERSTFRLVSELIGDHSDIPPGQVHPIFPMAPDTAARYERELRETLAWREPGHDRLDYVLLGLGADGTTAGLATVEDPEPADRLVVASEADNGDPGTVSMTLRLINASRFIGVMVTGATKQEAIVRIAAGGSTPGGGVSGAAMPILGVHPIGGVLRWYLDEAACPPPPPSSLPPAPQGGSEA